MFVSCNDSFVVVKPAQEINAPFYTYPLIQGLGWGEEINFFNSTLGHQTVARVSDDSDDSSITVGHFEGVTFDGRISEATDVFILKTDHQGRIIWSVVLNSLLPMINDSTGIEQATNIVIDQKNGTLYVAGITTGNLIETNTSGVHDIFLAKLTTSGTLLWVRHFGQEYGSARGIDFSYHERIGDLQLNSKGELVASIETTGNLFDQNAGVLGVAYDIGLMLISSATGDIIKGLQIGATTAATWGGNSSKNEYINVTSFAFDGKKIVVPFRTTGSIKDTNPNSANDAGYFVADENLNLLNLIHLGTGTYNNWSSQGNYSGNVNGDDQFRAVVVNGPGDYLLYGKTGSALGELNHLVDLLFVRFINNEVHSLVQYGSTHSPDWVHNEEPRQMRKTLQGIFCSGHLRSDPLNEGTLVNKPFVFKVDPSGQIIQEYYLSLNDKLTHGIDPTKHILVMTGDFHVKNNQIRIGLNVSSVSTSGPFSAFLWNISL